MRKSCRTVSADSILCISGEHAQETSNRYKSCDRIISGSYLKKIVCGKRLGSKTFAETEVVRVLWVSSRKHVFLKAGTEMVPHGHIIIIFYLFTQVIINHGRAKGPCDMRLDNIQKVDFPRLGG